MDPEPEAGELAGWERVNDKTGALRRMTGARLDLGCGPRKRAPDYIGIDLLDYDGVDIVGDALEVLRRVPAATVSEIYCSHFLEHVEDVSAHLQEFARVLRLGGRLEVIVPHFSNPYFYSDLTHRNYFGLYSLSYFSAGSPLKREVPTYGNTLAFTLNAVSLRFKSPPPFYGRYVVKRLLGFLFNASRGLREFYEENLCFIFPCYEIRFVLTRTSDRPEDGVGARHPTQ
jgi:hypothetical protein